MAEVTRSLRSQVQSARIWARTFAHGDAMSATARVGFREAESDAAAAASEFESYDPSPQDLGLRSRFVSFAAQATGEIAARLGRFERAVRS